MLSNVSIEHRWITTAGILWSGFRHQWINVFISRISHGHGHAHTNARSKKNKIQKYSSTTIRNETEQTRLLSELTQELW